MSVHTSSLCVRCVGWEKVLCFCAIPALFLREKQSGSPPVQPKLKTPHQTLHQPISCKGAFLCYLCMGSGRGGGWWGGTYCVRLSEKNWTKASKQQQKCQTNPKENARRESLHLPKVERLMIFKRLQDRCRGGYISIGHVSSVTR